MPSHPHPRRGVSPAPVTDPTEGGESSLCRVRSFKTTSKGGIVNRGDSVKRKAQKDHIHVHPTNSVPQDAEARRASSSDVECKCQNEENENEVFTVVVLGPAGVGKTLLTTQFMTSEYIGTSSDGDGKS